MSAILDLPWLRLPGLQQRRSGTLVVDLNEARDIRARQQREPDRARGVRLARARRVTCGAPTGVAVQPALFVPPSRGRRACGARDAYREDVRGARDGCLQRCN